MLEGRERKRRNIDICERGGDGEQEGQDSEKWEKWRCVCAGVGFFPPHLLREPSALLDSSTMSYCLSAFTTWFTSYDFSHFTGWTHTNTHIVTRTCTHQHTCNTVCVCHRCTQAHTWPPRSTGAPWVSTLPADGHTFHSTCLRCFMSLTVY